MWAKCDTLDDRVLFSERRLEEQSKNIQTLLELHKESHFTKLEDKVKLFQNEVYTTFKEMKTKIDSKLSTVDYEKQYKATLDRLATIAEQLVMKSDKLEVKKALLFVESKIKEIILVISEDEENEKDALITKKQIKCMSCDKDVDKFLGVVNNNRGNWDGLPAKEHAPESLGRFGMTGYGSLAKKIKKLEGKDLPVLTCKKSKDSLHQEGKGNA